MSSNKMSSKKKELFNKFLKSVDDYRLWCAQTIEDDTDEADSIEGMLAYLENQYNGFGKHNCEMTFQEEKQNEELYEKALQGFEYYKKKSEIKKELDKNNVKIRYTNSGKYILL